MVFQPVVVPLLSQGDLEAVLLQGVKVQSLLFLNVNPEHETCHGGWATNLAQEETKKSAGKTEGNCLRPAGTSSLKA